MARWNRGETAIEDAAKIVAAAEGLLEKLGLF